MLIEWECTECGYIEDGPRPPSRCPECGAPRHRFQRLDLDEEEEEFDLLEDFDDLIDEEDDELWDDEEDEDFFDEDEDEEDF